VIEDEREYVCIIIIIFPHLDLGKRKVLTVLFLCPWVATAVSSALYAICRADWMKERMNGKMLRATGLRSIWTKVIWLPSICIWTIIWATKCIFSFLIKLSAHGGKVFEQKRQAGGAAVRRRNSDQWILGAVQIPHFDYWCTIDVWIMWIYIDKIDQLRFKL